MSVTRPRYEQNAPVITTADANAGDVNSGTTDNLNAAADAALTRCTALETIKKSLFGSLLSAPPTPTVLVTPIVTPPNHRLYHNNRII